MRIKDVATASVAIVAAYAVGVFWGKRRAVNVDRANPTASLWAYYRVLIDVAHEIEALQPGSAVPRALHARVDQARRAAARVADALPADSRWITHASSLPSPGEHERLDLAYQFVILAEEIRSRLERLAADRHESPDQPDG